MTSIAGTSGTAREASPLRDGLILTWRFLKRIPRIPELAAFAILQSVMFVLLFAFVFGGAVQLPGFPADPAFYREFLMPGIFAQTIVFASATTAIGMAADIQAGIIDRFRSLPMARSAVLTGRTVSDVVYNLIIVLVLMATGLLVGWTVRTGVVELLAGIGLMLLFVFAMSWLGVWLGLSVGNVEVAQQIVFTVLFPLTFVSNAFVATAGMPDWLRPFAEWNPTSTLSASLRSLFGNPNPFPANSFPSENPILVTLVWVVVIVGVFGFLGIRRYRSMSR